MKGILHSLASSLKKRLDPTTRVMIEVGYLNSELERTQVGIHQILNFVEEKNAAAFTAWLKALKAEKIKDAKENGDCE